MRGFTLLEVVLYLGLFSLLMTGAVSSAIALGEHASRIHTAAHLTDEATFLLERMRYAIEYQGTIIEPGVGESTTRLVISDENTESEYFLDDSAFVEKRDETQSALTSAEGMAISNLAFTHAHSGRSGSTVHISFTLSIRDRRGAVITRTFTQQVHPLNQPIEI